MARRSHRTTAVAVGLVLGAITFAACAPIDPTAAEHAADYSEANGGQVLLVGQHGSTVLERTAPGWDRDTAHRLASGTKSFAGVLAIAAAEDGLLSLDEVAADTLIEWRNDPRKSRITIRQLLYQSSGLHPNAGWPGPDAHAAGIAAPARFEPGTRFDYGPNHFHAFAALLERKLVASGFDGDLLDYLRTRILDRIGLTFGRWNRDSIGHPLLSAGAYLSANEWVKLGTLIADRGAWNGAQVLDPALVDELASPSPTNPDYGLSWWLGAAGLDGHVSPDPANVPGDLVAAGGAGGQRLYVVPSRQIVVVRFSEDKTFDDATFLSLLFETT